MLLFCFWHQEFEPLKHQKYTGEDENKIITTTEKRSENTKCTAQCMAYKFTYIQQET